MVRKGILSDASIKAMCVVHQPVPLNRLNVLIPNPNISNGIYLATQSTPNYLSRPSSIFDMVNNLKLAPKEKEILLKKYNDALNKKYVVPAEDKSLDKIFNNPTDQLYARLAKSQGLLDNIILGVLPNDIKPVEQDELIEPLNRRGVPLDSRLLRDNMGDVDIEPLRNVNEQIERFEERNEDPERPKRGVKAGSSRGRYETKGAKRLGIESKMTDREKREEEMELREMGIE